ncbi:hypothetical protein VQ042_01945 [Aurantimonas sp. A2-1-M11]
MDRFIVDANIARFETRLACETDPSRRDTLMRLIAEEKERLNALLTRNG